MLNRPDGILAILIGVSRSGKSVYLKAIIEQVLRELGRVVVFDPKGEYVRECGFTGCYSREKFVSALARAGNGPAKIAFVAIEKDDFQFFCRVARKFNKVARSGIVCEELANVTNAGAATGEWGKMVSQSLAEGPIIIGTVQRGQEVDKSIINNATYVHVTRHSTIDDRKYVAKKLGVPLEYIPDTKLHFLQWSGEVGMVTRGQIDFLKSRKRAWWPLGAPRFKTYEGQEIKPIAEGHFDMVVYTK